MVTFSTNTPFRIRMASPSAAASTAAWIDAYGHPIEQTVRVAPRAAASTSKVPRSKPIARTREPVG
jgi:hypothetical protein